MERMASFNEAMYIVDRCSLLGAILQDLFPVPTGHVSEAAGDLRTIVLRRLDQIPELYLPALDLVLAVLSQVQHSSFVSQNDLSLCSYHLNVPPLVHLFPPVYATPPLPPPMTYAPPPLHYHHPSPPPLPSSPSPPPPPPPPSAQPTTSICSNDLFEDATINFFSGQTLDQTNDTTEECQSDNETASITSSSSNATLTPTKQQILQETTEIVVSSTNKKATKALKALLNLPTSNGPTAKSCDEQSLTEMDASGDVKQTDLKCNSPLSNGDNQREHDVSPATTLEKPEVVKETSTEKDNQRDHTIQPTNSENEIDQHANLIPPIKSKRVMSADEIQRIEIDINEIDESVKLSNRAIELLLELRFLEAKYVLDTFADRKSTIGNYSAWVVRTCLNVKRKQKSYSSSRNSNSKQKKKTNTGRGSTTSNPHYKKKTGGQISADIESRELFGHHNCENSSKKQHRYSKSTSDTDNPKREKNNNQGYYKSHRRQHNTTSNRNSKNTHVNKLKYQKSTPVYDDVPELEAISDDESRQFY